MYFVDDEEHVLLECSFPEITGCSSSRSARGHGQSFSLSTVKVSNLRESEEQEGERERGGEERREREGGRGGREGERGRGRRGEREGGKGRGGGRGGRKAENEIGIGTYGRGKGLHGYT